MKQSHSLSRSSLFVSIPAILISLAIFIIAVLQGEAFLSLIFASLFLFSLVSRIWAKENSKKIEATLILSNYECFPHTEIKATLKVKNNKFLPLMWMKLYMPLSKKLSVLPLNTRVPDTNDIPLLSSRGESTEVIGEERIGRLLWYEEASFSFTLKAEKRGVTHLESWYLSSGDGFGLSESDIPLTNTGEILVYPELVDVNIDPFIENLWNSETGPKGIMDDITVIKSTRDYLPFDSVKHINWRLLARKQGVKVNTYEMILPKSILVIFDGESFSGPVAMRNEMEEALKVVASIMVELEEREIHTSLALPHSFSSKEILIGSNEALSTKLSSLATYDVLPDKLNSNGTEMVRQNSIFTEDEIIQEGQKCGHIFYFSALSEDVLLLPFVKNLGPEKITIVPYVNKECDNPYSVLEWEKVRREK